MYRALLCIALTLAALPARADWQVVNVVEGDSHQRIRAARIENPAGYSLEIYRDRDGTIRSRFHLAQGFAEFAPHLCPTFQVDSREPVNASIGDKSCRSGERWAEFVLGYVTSGSVTSLVLHRLMNGETVTYRFALAHGGYRQTSFSLKGSNYAITQALGGLRIEAR